MARKRFGITFEGFNELAERYEKAGGNLKYIVEKCLEPMPDIVNPNLKRDMEKHRRSKTHSAADSLSTDKRVQWEGTTAYIPIGFKIRPYGLPTIFLMYGTKPHTPKNQYGVSTKSNKRPYTKKDEKLYNDIYGSAIRRKINTTQKEIFVRELKKIIGG